MLLFLGCRTQVAWKGFDEWSCNSRVRCGNADNVCDRFVGVEVRVVIV